MKGSWFVPRCGAILVLLALCVSSCALLPSDRLVIWTDHPEFALYVEYFNAAQDKYKAEVRFFESPSQKMAESGEYPDIVAASWLKSASIRTYFRSLDSLFSNDGLSASSFYPSLLALGYVDNHQYLLPVSYNIPAIIFARDFGQNLSSPFTIGMEEIKEQSGTFNALTGGSYTRMGFPVSSSNEFLFITATLFGASFREASPVAWETQALEQCVTWIQSWIAEANTNIQMEDDFVFKYFYEPSDKLIASGRILYTYMDSSRFFTLPEERRANLDFRWIAAGDNIPVNEMNTYYGIHKRTRAMSAAKAFTRWFFKDETQRLLLEAGKNARVHETSFGISGGFSAMKTVTEQVFPQFYPGLLGRLPPESYLSPGNILPRNWVTVKERVILPYLQDRIRHPNREEVRPLERRIGEWYRLNREWR